MNYGSSTVGDVALPVSSPSWLSRLAVSLASVDRVDYLRRIEEFNSFVRSSGAALAPGRLPLFSVRSSRPDDVALSLSLHDSGGWGRVSLASEALGGDPLAVGVDLSPDECRLLARSLLDAAHFLEHNYPEHGSLARGSAV